MLYLIDNINGNKSNLHVGKVVLVVGRSHPLDMYDVIARGANKDSLIPLRMSELVKLGGGS